MLTTQEMGEYELQVAAQDRIVQPRSEFKAVVGIRPRRQPPGPNVFNLFGVQRRIYRRARRNAIEPAARLRCARRTAGQTPNATR